MSPLIFSLSLTLLLLSSSFNCCSSSPDCDRNADCQVGAGFRRMTLKGGTSQACAACKYQRRKCRSECPLAPYFPADQPKMFQNAHKLFGVSKIHNILKSLDATQKAEAMRSIIYQSYVRDRYPVHGCLGVISHLRYQIWQAEEELHAVRQQLELYRQHKQQQQIVPLPEDMPSQLELGMAPPTNNTIALNIYNHNPQSYCGVATLPIAQHPAYSSDGINGAACNSLGYIDAKEDTVSPSWVQNPVSADGSNTIQSQLTSSQAQAIQPDIVQDYDEIHQIIHAIDDRQSYVSTKEPYDHTSSEEPLKGTTQCIEHIADNELKNAAARFTLTSVT